MSFDRLIGRIMAMQNPTAAGLDPRLEYIPDFIKEEAFARCGENAQGAAEAFLAFNKALIDALWDIVPAVKPQVAFYEAYGWQGMKALAETISYARSKGMYIITDGKRNDIGSTMAAYADAHLGTSRAGSAGLSAFEGDCLTVNGYLGTDGIAPLLKYCESADRAIFVLVKTSNPSSGELQDKLIDSLPVYRHMGDMCERWGQTTRSAGGYSAVGAVVGATYPAQLADLRRQLPHTFFLVPGYGAQGGGAEDVVGAFDQNGLGAVINSSRGIMAAWQKEGCGPRQFAAAARREALRMKEDITSRISIVRNI